MGSFSLNPPLESKEEKQTFSATNLVVEKSVFINIACNNIFKINTPRHWHDSDTTKS